LKRAERNGASVDSDAQKEERNLSRLRYQFQGKKYYVGKALRVSLL